MRTHHLGLLGAVLLTGTLTLACSAEDDGRLADTRSIDSTTDAEQGSEGDGDGSSSSGEPGSGGGDEVIGTARAQLTAGAIDERTIPVRIDVTRLERHGDLIELTLRLTNEAPVEGDDPPGFTANTMFGANYDASGIGLVDGDAQKLYLPVLDSDDSCLCTGDLGNSEIPAGDALTISATYGGVPDDVDAIDVRVPGFPTIAGVPVQ